MRTPGLRRYEVVLGDRYFLRELIEDITLTESLDEIAYRAELRLVVTNDLPNIAPGQEIRVSGMPFGSNNMAYLLHPAVVWECDSKTRGQKHITVTAYDRTIYLQQSEDEYLFPAGQTASQRLRKYAADWGIPLANIPDTGVPLSKAVYRARPIYQMIMSDLQETVKKGGKMFRPRMTPNGLELYEIGTNKTVWVLDQDQNIEELSQLRTLQGAVTQAKVLGTQGKSRSDQLKINTNNMTDEELEEYIRKYAIGNKGSKSKGPKSNEIPSPVLTVVKGETSKYGTIQKVIQDESIKNAAQAKKAGEEALTGVQESFSVTALDINTIRAGDKVQLNKMNLIVKSVRHELGSPGHMTLDLTWPEMIRREVYGYGSFS